MQAPSPEIMLDLRTLADEAELSRSVSEAIALAASIVLDRVHGPQERFAVRIHEGAQTRTGELRPAAIDARDRATYGDPQEATEEGAEGVGVAVARRVLDRIVFRRLPKGTGADYLMRDPHLGDGDSYERLECSGIADGDESAASRLRKKLAQLGDARQLDTVPGHAVVTSFRTTPVEIQLGRHSR